MRHPAKTYAAQAFGRFVDVRVGAANFFLGQSMGIDENNSFQLKFSILHQNLQFWAVCGR